MIAERAGQNFSLLILDEVFGSLDEARDSTSWSCCADCRTGSSRSF
jgi:ABC-type nitrate/sulfonate/bicarbonate transport system ATPase subunit